MTQRDSKAPVEVIAGCPVCGAVFEEAERIGSARVEIHSACPRCGAPLRPDEDRSCGPKNEPEVAAG